MLDANRAHIALTISGVDTDLQVLAFDGLEALNAPYRCDLERGGERADLDRDHLLNRPVWLTFGAAGLGANGIGYRAAQTESSPRLIRSRLSRHSRPSLLQHALQHLDMPQRNSAANRHRYHLRTLPLGSEPPFKRHANGCT